MTNVENAAPESPDVKKVPTQTKGILGAFATFIAALIAVMTSLEWVPWTAQQTTLVSVEAAAAFALLAALVAHYSKNTKREPVAIGASITALATATLGLGTGFAWWTLRSDQLGAIVGVVTAAVGVGSALIARELVVAEQKPIVPE